MRTRLAFAAAAALSLVSAPAAMAAPATDDSDVVDIVVVASGTDAHLVDSLTAGPLAASLGASLYLVGPDGGAPALKARLDAATEETRVYVIGGPAAIPVTLDAYIDANEELEAVRLAGEDRYETNAAVNVELDRLLSLDVSVG